MEGETVTRDDTIDTRKRAPAARLIEIAASGPTIFQFRNLAPISYPVSTDRIAIFPVPFSSSRRAIPNLVASRADILGLGDELDLRQHRVLPDHIEKPAQPIDLV